MPRGYSKETGLPLRPTGKKKEPEASVAVQEPLNEKALDKEVEKRIAANITIKNLPKIIRRPDIRAGVCESCGAGWEICICSKGNYHSMDVACTFCRNKAMTNYRNLEVFSLQETPHIYVFVCSDQKCIRACSNQFLSRK